MLLNTNKFSIWPGVKISVSCQSRAYLTTRGVLSSFSICFFGSCWASSPDRSSVTRRPRACIGFVRHGICFLWCSTSFVSSYRVFPLRFYQQLNTPSDLHDRKLCLDRESKLAKLYQLSTQTTLMIAFAATRGRHWDHNGDRTNVWKMFWDENLLSLLVFQFDWALFER